MNALVKKEIRLLLPAWGMALLVAEVAPWTDWIHGVPDHDLVLFFGGALFLAVASFGREFSLGTLFPAPVTARRAPAILAGQSYGSCWLRLQLCWQYSVSLSRRSIRFRPSTFGNGLPKLLPSERRFCGSKPLPPCLHSWLLPAGFGRHCCCARQRRHFGRPC